MGPEGGDTHRGLEVEGSMVAGSKSTLLFLFLGLLSPTSLEVPGTEASSFSSIRSLAPNLLLGLIKTGLTAGDPGGRKGGVAVGEETVDTTGTTYPGIPTLAPENRRGVWVRMVSIPGNPFTGGGPARSPPWDYQKAQSQTGVCRQYVRISETAGPIYKSIAPSRYGGLAYKEI